MINKIWLRIFPWGTTGMTGCDTGSELLMWTFHVLFVMQTTWEFTLKTYSIEFVEQFMMGNAINDIKTNDISLILSDHHNYD